MTETYKNDISHQVEQYIDHGIHELLGFNQSEYRNSIVNSIDTSKINNHNNIVFVENRISLQSLFEISGINDFLGTGNIRNEKWKTHKPYLIEVVDSKRYLGLSPQDAEQSFEPGEIGCNIFEIASIYFCNKEKCDGRALDSLLSWFRVDYHPSLVVVGGTAEIKAHWHQDATSNIGVISKKKVHLTK